MAGTQLIIRGDSSITYMAVRENGQTIIDWLSNRPSLGQEAKELIKSWLDFHKPSRSDNSIARNQRTITVPFGTEETEPEKVFETGLVALAQHAPKNVTEEERTEIRCGQTGYKVLIHGNLIQIYNKDQWMGLEEALMQQGQIKRGTDSFQKTGYPLGLPCISDRGFALGGKPEHTPVIAVELTEKWSSLYVIQPDGKVNKFNAVPKYKEVYKEVAEDFPEITESDFGWNPRFVAQVAQRLGITIGSLSNDLLTGRWVNEHDAVRA